MKSCFVLPVKGTVKGTVKGRMPGAACGGSERIPGGGLERGGAGAGGLTACGAERADTGCAGATSREERSGQQSRHQLRLCTLIRETGPA